MAQRLFRKAALDRLSSPEQLDQLITVTTPRAWLAIIAIGFILATALLWGVFGSIPTKVNGQGIITKSYGVYNIISARSGQITDIRVSEGDLVKGGDVVANIGQPQLVDQITDLKTLLEQLKNLDMTGANLNKEENLGSGLNELYELARRIKEARADLPYKEANYNNAISGREYEIQKAKLQLDEAGVREQHQRTYIEKLTILANSGAISENDLTNAKRDLDLLQLEVQAAEEELNKITAGDWEDTIITYSEKLQQAQLTVQLLEEQFATTKAIKILDTEGKIKKLQEELNLASTVATQVDGRVLELKVNKGDIVQPGTRLFSVEREGGTIKLEVVMYVPAEEGKKILPGMEAMISPSTVKKEEYGYILGRVVSVSEYPATSQGMLHTLGNEGLVSKLAGQGAALELHIDVTLDDSTESGFKWSSPKGPPVKINSGTLCTGAVTVSRQRPISMVIPTIKSALSF